MAGGVNMGRAGGESKSPDNFSHTVPVLIPIAYSGCPGNSAPGPTICITDTDTQVIVIVTIGSVTTGQLGGQLGGRYG